MARPLDSINLIWPRSESFGSEAAQAATAFQIAPSATSAKDAMIQMWLPVLPKARSWVTPGCLSDTLEHLSGAEISAVGAGVDAEHARAPVLLEAGGLRVAVLGLTDHPAGFSAGPDQPGSPTQA